MRESSSVPICSGTSSSWVSSCSTFSPSAPTVFQRIRASGRSGARVFRSRSSGAICVSSFGDLDADLGEALQEGSPAHRVAGRPPVLRRQALVVARRLAKCLHRLCDCCGGGGDGGRRPNWFGPPPDPRQTGRAPGGRALEESAGGGPPPPEGGG